MVVHRFGQWLFAKTSRVRLLLEPLYVFFFHRIRTKWGIEIGRDAQIGPGCYIGRASAGSLCPAAHGSGQTAPLSHGVTIGWSGYGDPGPPTIGHDVSVAPGAELLGRIRIGHNVKIGANVVKCDDIPDHAVVALAPGYTILSYKGNRVQMATNA